MPDKIENQVKEGWTIIFLWKKKFNIEKAEFYQIGNDMLKILKDSGIHIEK